MTDLINGFLSNPNSLLGITSLVGGAVTFAISKTFPAKKEKQIYENIENQLKLRALTQDTLILSEIDDLIDLEIKKSLIISDNNLRGKRLNPLAMLSIVFVGAGLLFFCSFLAVQDEHLNSIRTIFAVLLALFIIIPISYTIRSAKDFSLFWLKSSTRGRMATLVGISIAIAAIIAIVFYFASQGVPNSISDRLPINQGTSQGSGGIVKPLTTLPTDKP